MITDASQYLYVTIPAGVSITNSHFSLPMPVRDHTSDAANDRAFRGVDPAFLLEAIGERSVAGWRSAGAFQNSSFGLGVEASPFVNVIRWMLYGSADSGGVGSSSPWRRKPQQAARIAASSASDSLASVYGGVLSAADVTADAADFAGGNPPRRASVLKIFDDLYSFRHFVTRYFGNSNASETASSSSYTLTGAYVGDENASARSSYETARAKYSAGGGAIGTSDVYYHGAQWNDWTGGALEPLGKYGFEVTAGISTGTFQVSPPAAAGLTMWGTVQAYALVKTFVYEDASATYYDWTPLASSTDAAQRKITVAAADVAGAAAAVLAARGIVAKGTGSLGRHGSQEITQSVLGFDFAVDLGDHTDWRKYIDDNFGGN